MYSRRFTNAPPSRRWFWVPLIFAAALLAVLVGGWLYFGSAGPSYPGEPTGFWWFPFGWLFIPIVFLAFFSLRWFFWGGWGYGWGGGWYAGGHDDSAIATLRERFARGEITKEQYEQMRRDLEGSSQ